MLFQTVWSKAVLRCALYCIALQSTVFPYRQGLWYINHFIGMISKKGMMIKALGIYLHRDILAKISLGLEGLLLSVCISD